MTDLFAGIAPVFSKSLRGPKLPPKPSDQAIALAQRSYDGQKVDDEIVHVMRHRFPTVEQAEAAADELKRAGSYTTPPSSVRTLLDPDQEGDKRVLAWTAGARRGRGSSASA